MRECRIALGKSQAAFAAMLGVSPESYRTWDARYGGRHRPTSWRRATGRSPRIAMSTRSFRLAVLALLIGVHVKTLRRQTGGCR